MIATPCYITIRGNWPNLFHRLSLLFLLLAVLPSRAVESLTAVEYRVSGIALQVTPVAVSVPKGIAGSVLVSLTGGDAAQSLAQGAYVEAILRGPSLPEPRRLVGLPNAPLLLPALNLVGD
jgi:hypothetical protein